MSINVTVPDIGDFEKVEIIEILVKSGDNIKKKWFNSYSWKW